MIIKYYEITGSTLTGSYKMQRIILLYQIEHRDEYLFEWIDKDPERVK